ncbi:UDP-GlcNAc:betaGal beta-1,3-N-acetylglucosaminyltransferase-like protein 1 isoform X2 [Ruditapes philippinarum]|uniref:UDP-GlcNAc:betaGal beta-1,3-N-acetylglucosaminyltransferase-like protein 1 isoform X2 n=1 Tax=Ruditapes philippinarum TaxID=129788 RepID=UPI00295C1F99|nr:UDP-GlcNAc:betaGal beta-1,3-N-acetylglucosaminyltransferase-like protein 1 isoform X2 [Ruditapes philippinarum]
MTTTVSVILPVHNADKWLDECLQSVVNQTYSGSLELSVYQDSCTDNSEEIIKKWRTKLEEQDVKIVIGGHSDKNPRGVGYAKNRAIDQSSGQYLCFLDADDVMDKDRILEQYTAAKAYPDSIIGCKFHRDPEGSTERFTKWANMISQEQLLTQVYTSHGPTVIMPTWFCSRKLYDNVGSFSKAGKGVPEDLIFFYKHLELGGGLYRVEKDLLMYRYHTEATTFSVKEETIWKERVQFLEKQVLTKWPTFTIWNAGKQGRKLYRSLSAPNQKKVVAFCDVDEKKISKGVYIYEESKDLTHGDFERNLESLQLTEGQDYFHFN